MKFILRAKTRTLRGSVELPGSKSISNRLLIINALARKKFDLFGLSEADDTRVLSQALQRNDIITDVGPAGTAMRFLTAYFASLPGERILTGSERMKQRPIHTLVEALRSLGANITYLEKEGFPPLHIHGRRLNGGDISINGNVSSQFITALMLIGPTLPQPLRIKITGNPLSRPYISMTQSLMRSCGAQVELDAHEIVVMPGRYRSPGVEVERDWSSAAFWMAFAALSNKTELTLKGLSPNSIQGDANALEVFAAFGIKGEFNETGLIIRKSATPSENIEWNFRNHPDLVQPAMVAAAGLAMKGRFDGLDNLRLKETDRIAALCEELANIGVKAQVHGNSILLNGDHPSSPENYFKSYDDHRMVMSVASLSMRFPEILIENPMTVAKSYPGFWKQVERFVDVRPTR